MGIEDKFDEVLRSNEKLINKKIRKPNRKVLTNKDIEYVASQYELNKFDDRLVGDTSFETRKQPHFHEFLVCLDEPIEVKIVCMYLINSLSFDNIGVTLNMHRQQVRRTYHSAIDKIKDRVKYEGRKLSPRTEF